MKILGGKYLHQLIYILFLKIQYLGGGESIGGNKPPRLLLQYWRKLVKNNSQFAKQGMIEAWSVVVGRTRLPQPIRIFICLRDKFVSGNFSLGITSLALKFRFFSLEFMACKSISTTIGTYFKSFHIFFPIVMFGVPRHQSLLRHGLQKRSCTL